MPIAGARCWLDLCLAQSAVTECPVALARDLRHLPLHDPVHDPTAAWYCPDCPVGNFVGHRRSWPSHVPSARYHGSGLFGVWLCHGRSVRIIRFRKSVRVRAMSGLYGLRTGANSCRTRNCARCRFAGARRSLCPARTSVGACRSRSCSRGPCPAFGLILPV